MEELKHINKFIKNKSDLEIEIKLGRYINTQFTADVNKIIFSKLFNLLKNDKIIHKRSISCENNKNRVELFLNKENEIIEIEELHKNKFKNIDLQNDNMRISLSTEKIILNESNLNKIKDILKKKYSNVGCFRYKDRKSIEFKNKIWRFDFTKVYDIKDSKSIYDFIEKISKKNIKYRLEVEIEYIGDYSDNLFKSIQEIKKEIQYILNIKQCILNSIQEKLTNSEFNSIKKLNTTRWNSKQLMTSVQNLNLITLNHIMNTDMNYSISEKADGERLLLYINENDVYVIDNSLNINVLNDIDNISNSISDDLSKKLYLFDLEFIPEKNLYLIFDCIIFDDKDISSLSLDKRINYINKIKWIPNNIKIKNHYLSTKNDFFEICKKVYLQKKYNYKIDGLIFTPISQQYRCNVYKWKPPEEQSIDFFILIIHSNKLNTNKSELILDLYVTTPSNKFSKYNKSKFKYINPKSKYVPFLFSKNNKIIVERQNDELFFIKKNKEKILIKNMSIIEMTFQKGSWFPHKNRFDKDTQYYESIKKGIFDGPNGLNIANFIMELIKKPITTEMITTGQIYYVGVNKKNSLIQNMIKFNNTIKKDLYKNYLKKDMKLLELSGGRGGDLYPILEKNPSYVFFTDYAKDGLIEAKRRYNDFTLKNSKLKTNIKFEEYNLRKNVSNNIINKSSKTKFDLVSCQFAIHYFFENEKNWNNFFNVVNNSIKKNGIFMFTVFDGKRIIDKLKKLKKNDKLEYKINNKVVLSFKKLYDGRKKSVFGKTLGCFVETIGEHPEYLVDIEYIIKFFEDNNYELVENTQFDTLFENFNIKLSDVEKEFTGFYNKVVFRKL